MSGLPSRSPGPQLPGSIRAAFPHPVAGKVVMSGFPGLEMAVDGTASFMPDNCRETLEGILALGATDLHVLIEDDELDDVFLASLASTAQSLGLGIVRFPIVDYGAPTDDAARHWLQGADARKAAFAKGATVAFACQYGAGRSGMMAACCLIEGGQSPSEAIAFVRSHFAEAIESEAQEAWLQSLG